ncbi:MAG: peptide deformylase [Proteobacteria bacterium]|nr:peptide deformylase [Pseudomonadota bacterium]MBU1713118.1 peptide deformylase [Pseudomonadota bacterium]
MAILDILTYPDKFLTKKVRPVEKIDGALNKIIDDMIETMYEAPGIGLASIQIGCDKSIVVYDLSYGENENSLQVLLNPKITESCGEIVSENEGCLSVPDYRSDVKRAASVIVEALNREGKPLRIEAENFHATVLQHEIDHLNGILFIDRISKLKKGIYRRHLLKQLKQNET